MSPDFPRSETMPFPPSAVLPEGCLGQGHLCPFEVLKLPFVIFICTGPLDFSIRRLNVMAAAHSPWKIEHRTEPDEWW